MPRILRHPILDTTPARAVTFTYEGVEVAGEEGFTIAAALHQAGFPVHSHSLKNRNRSLECGIARAEIIGPTLMSHSIRRVTTIGDQPDLLSHLIDGVDQRGGGGHRQFTSKRFILGGMRLCVKVHHHGHARNGRRFINFAMQETSPRGRSPAGAAGAHRPRRLPPRPEPGSG